MFPKYKKRQENENDHDTKEKKNNTSKKRDQAHGFHVTSDNTTNMTSFCIKLGQRHKLTYEDILEKAKKYIVQAFIFFM